MFAAEVIGVGNESRGDDGIGPAVVRRLLERGLPPGVCARTHDGETMSLLAAWEDSDTIIMIDAVDCGAPPGTVVCLDGSKIQAASGLLGGSSHDLGLAQAVLLARALGRSPKTLIVFGVQGEQFALSYDLSPSVRGTVATLADRVIALLDELLTPGLEPASLTIRVQGSASPLAARSEASSLRPRSQS